MSSLPPVSMDTVSLVQINGFLAHRSVKVASARVGQFVPVNGTFHEVCQETDSCCLVNKGVGVVNLTSPVRVINLAPQVSLVKRAVKLAKSEKLEIRGRTCTFPCIKPKELNLSTRPMALTSSRHCTPARMEGFVTAKSQKWSLEPQK